MAVRVHVLRTCDRCGRPIDADGAIPVQQLREGDVIPVFHRTVLRVVREEPGMDGGPPVVKVLGTFTDLCAPCEGTIERALDTLLRRSGEGDAEGAAGAGAAAGEASDPAKRRRAVRAPRPVNPAMPGPDGTVPPSSPAASGATAAEGASASEPVAEAPPGADVGPDAALASAVLATGGTPLAASAGDESDHPF